jgi:uncharacterized YigZ family protein
MDFPEDGYQTVEDLLSAATFKVKGSRFIVHVLHVPDKDAAERSYHELKKKFHDATHNCYAYRIDRQNFRYSDDGEPSGTAGKPILQTIEGRGLYQTMVVVTRYFGGTKLGAGGLIHAYTDSAIAGLDAVRIKQVLKAKTLEILTTYDKISMIENLIRKFQGSVVHSDYKDLIHLQIAVPDKNLTAFQKAVLPFIQAEEP